MLDERMILAGFGGQGLMLLGKLLAYSLMKEGKNVSYIPSHGPEMRGGVANCNVCISDNEIASPLVEEATVIIAMNAPSYEKFSHRIKKDGYIFVNTSLVKTLKESAANIIKIDASDLANELGDVKVANMVMLGALLKKKNSLIQLERLFIHLKDFLASKGTLYELNKAAILKGYNHFAN